MLLKLSTKWLTFSIGNKWHKIRKKIGLYAAWPSNFELDLVQLILERRYK